MMAESRRYGCRWRARLPQRFRCASVAMKLPYEPPKTTIVAFTGLLLLLLVLVLRIARRPPGFVRTCLRLAISHDRRLPGELTGIRFPTHSGQLTAETLTNMLRNGGHLDERTSVVTMSDRLATIRDGVKGDKAIVDVTYDQSTALPSTFFVKFALRGLSPMRLLCVTSEVCECEALFYKHLSGDCPLRTPHCYFVDYNEAAATFVLVTETVPFGSDAVRPLKHRVRDAPQLDEQRAFIAAGVELHCAFWGDAALQRGLRRYDATHRRVWTLMQLIGGVGLPHTASSTLKGRPVRHLPFVTWADTVPTELLGHEYALAMDMPKLLTALCDEVEMTAFGHNDLVTDNAFFSCAPVGGARGLGLFDWQQACVNSIGQEWAWNWSFLPPEWLTEHEDALIDQLLTAYREHGRPVARSDFVRHYALGVAQMYVFSGGSLQALMSRLDKRGLLEGLQPDDVRCRDGSLAHNATLLELHVGAEMSRRAFTNACNIMRRHDFVGHWRRWRDGQSLYGRD